jgi:hypothetical protein
MNRNLLAETESFAQEVHVLLTTGASLTTAPKVAHAAAANKPATNLQQVPA